jgi:hypothetical protein
MKRNILIKTESGSFKAVPMNHISDASSIVANLGPSGEEKYAGWVAVDAEESLIQSIDEQRHPESQEKKRAKKFLIFLGNHRLSLLTLRALPAEEQKRLKDEFLLGE